MPESLPSRLAANKIVVAMGAVAIPIQQPRRYVGHVPGTVTIQYDFASSVPVPIPVHMSVIVGTVDELVERYREQLTASLLRTAEWVDFEKQAKVLKDLGWDRGPGAITIPRYVAPEPLELKADAVPQ